MPLTLSTIGALKSHLAIPPTIAPVPSFHKNDPVGLLLVDRLSPAMSGSDKNNQPNQLMKTINQINQQTR